MGSGIWALRAPSELSRVASSLPARISTARETRTPSPQAQHDECPGESGDLVEVELRVSEFRTSFTPVSGRDQCLQH